MTCKHLITPPSISAESAFSLEGEKYWITIERGGVNVEGAHTEPIILVRCRWTTWRGFRLRRTQDRRSATNFAYNISVYLICIPVCLLRGANRTNCNYWASYKYDNNRCIMRRRLPIKRYDRYKSWAHDNMQIAPELSYFFSITHFFIILII